jgi:hypothetical protein
MSQRQSASGAFLFVHQTPRKLLGKRETFTQESCFLQKGIGKIRKNCDRHLDKVTKNVTQVSQIDIETV